MIKYDFLMKKLNFPQNLKFLAVLIFIILMNGCTITFQPGYIGFPRVPSPPPVIAAPIQQAVPRIRNLSALQTQPRQQTGTKSIASKKAKDSNLFLLAPLSYFDSQNGLITVKSNHNFKNTSIRLQSLLKTHGMKIFARVNHVILAKQAGKTLRPTELFLFGNPITSTRLMQCQQSIAIDLPLKILVWEDKKAQVWLSYNKPDFLTNRHNFANCAQKVIKKMVNQLTQIINEVSQD
jgi:uncharacterized protein (DUF302 family)